MKKNELLEAKFGKKEWLLIAHFLFIFRFEKSSYEIEKSNHICYTVIVYHLRIHFMEEQIKCQLNRLKLAINHCGNC